MNPDQCEKANHSFILSFFGYFSLSLSLSSPAFLSLSPVFLSPLSIPLFRHSPLFCPSSFFLFFFLPSVFAVVIFTSPTLSSILGRLQPKIHTYIHTFIHFSTKKEPLVLKGSSFGLSPNQENVLTSFAEPELGKFSPLSEWPNNSGSDCSNKGDQLLVRTIFPQCVFCVCAL